MMVVLCVSTQIHLPWCVCVYRTASWSWLIPFTFLWVVGIKLKSPGCVFTHLAIAQAQQQILLSTLLAGESTIQPT